MESKNKTTKKRKVIEDIENAHLDPYKSSLRDIARAYADSNEKQTAEALDKAFYVLTMAKQFDSMMADKQDNIFESYK